MHAHNFQLINQKMFFLSVARLYHIVFRIS
uniref:Uncharacterized protein n=1 Tax=Anguilla anguilla TaxID=7936 RepID=A0A0E9S9F7_ANGAN